MDAGLNWLWQGCIVALASCVLLRLLERARANVRYVVCWAALVLIVVLPALRWLGTAAPRPDAPLSTTAAIVSVPDAWWTSSAVMIAAWLAWASVFAVRFVWALVALRRARLRSQPFPSQVESLLCHWRRVRGQGRRPALVVSDSVPAAAVLGCGAPAIAVAPSLLATLEGDELDRVLIHEWAHVQRRDDLAHLLQIAMRIVAGWHPAVWWIERRLHVEREMACDEMTVALTGSPKSYAACLVKLASLGGAQPIALAGPAVLTASGLRARITKIVSRHAFIGPFWSRSIAAGIVSALCVVWLGVGGLKLVEVTALALPFESIRTVSAVLPGTAPVAVPSPAQHFEPPRPAAEHPAPAAAPAPRPILEPDAQIMPDTASDSTVPQATTEAGDDAGAAPEPSTLLHVPPGPQSEATVDRARSSWAKVADGGTALGRKSKDAGVATAGFFSRFARRVAGSF